MIKPGDVVTNVLLKYENFEIVVHDVILQNVPYFESLLKYNNTNNIDLTNTLNNLELLNGVNFETVKNVLLLIIHSFYNSNYNMKDTLICEDLGNTIMILINYFNVPINNIRFMMKNNIDMWIEYFEINIGENNTNLSQIKLIAKMKELVNNMKNIKGEENRIVKVLDLYYFISSHTDILEGDFCNTVKIKLDEFICEVDSSYVFYLPYMIFFSVILEPYF